MPSSCRPPHSPGVFRRVDGTPASLYIGIEENTYVPTTPLHRHGHGRKARRGRGGTKTAGEQGDARGTCAASLALQLMMVCWLDPLSLRWWRSLCSMVLPGMVCCLWIEASPPCKQADQNFGPQAPAIRYGDTIQQYSYQHSR